MSFFGLQRAPCLALKTHQLVWLGDCPPQTIMTHGTAYMVAHQDSLQAPTGLKGWTRETRGIEGRMERGEIYPTSKMKRTGMTLNCSLGNSILILKVLVLVVLVTPGSPVIASQIGTCHSKMSHSPCGQLKKNILIHNEID